MDNNELKKQAFDKDFKLLIKQLQEVIQVRYGTTIEIGDIRPELYNINRYSNIYNTMDPDEHYQYFEEIYNKNRDLILNGYDNDKWIKTTNLVVQFGSGNPELIKKCKDIKIPLSRIYLISKELQEKAEKILEGLDDKFTEETGGKDLVRPNIIILHTMRIFYYLVDDKDKITIGKIVTKYENELGVKNKTVSENNLISVENNPTSNIGENGLKALFGTAKNLMKKIGINPPEGVEEPTEDELANVVNNMFNNKATQSVIQNMFSSMSDTTDFSSAIKSMLEKGGDPEILKNIEKNANFTDKKE